MMILLTIAVINRTLRIALAMIIIRKATVRCKMIKGVYS